MHLKVNKYNMSKKLKPEFITIISSILFSAVFIYFLNPELHYHIQQIAWLSDSGFLKYYLGFAGGTVEYFALLLSQFFASRVFGSLIIIAVLTISLFFLWKISVSISKNLLINSILICIFPIAMVALLIDYRFYFSVILNFAIVLMFLYSEQFFRHSEKVKSVFILLSGIILYYISGGAYFLVYIISTSLLTLTKPRKIQLFMISTLALFSFFIPFVFYKFVFSVSIEQAFLKATPDVAPMLRYNQSIFFKATYFIIPLIILISIVSSKFSGLKSINRKKKILQFLPVVLIAIGFTSIWFLVYKPQSKIKAEIDYYAHMGEWDKVIELTGRVDEYDRMINFQYNRAISYKNEMLDKLFNYPQLLGIQGLFLDKPFTSEVALASSDLYFDLGNIDESQRFAFEAQTLMHFSPRVLSRLTINSIILENYNAAKTFGNVLMANPNGEKWINEMMPLIENPETAAGNPLIAEKRKLSNKPEGIFLTPRDKLVGLLEKNPGNKKAFDYLIAFDLMEHDLAGFSKHMEYFPKTGYKKLPLVIEEAVILFLSQRPDNEFLKSFSLSANTKERFNDFAKLMQSAKGDKQKARQVTEAFRECYWYYVLFSSPLVTKVQVETRPSEANY